MPATYAWIIDKDVLFPAYSGDTNDAKGLKGPRNLCPELEKKLDAGEGMKFKMYDDDGELYYEGRLVGGQDGEECFSPLDDFGTPNAGAVRIDYWNEEKQLWETM